MAHRVFRVCRAIYATLDGLGAKRASGRWNSPGRAVVYMAESISLAVLENLVHMSHADFPEGYVSIAAMIPDNVSTLTPEVDLREFTQMGPLAVGDRWFDSRISAALRVRSAVVIDESNYLLKPEHPDFARIIVEPAKAFTFDGRLFAGQRQP